MKAVAQFEEADAVIDHMVAELHGRQGDPTPQTPSDLFSGIPDDFFNISKDQDVEYPYFPPALRGGNDDPMAEYPDEEPPSDTATDGREDLGASNNVNADVNEGAEGQETRMRSQTSVPIILIAAPIMNNEPTRNTKGNEFSKMENGYHLSSSTLTPANVCNRFRDIHLSPSPEAMEISYGQPTSIQCYAPVRPHRARDFNIQQAPIVAHSSEQVENSQLQPDDFELNSYEKIFSGPLLNPENQIVGPSSSHHGCDSQHQSWSSTTEATSSRTDSEYLWSPSTSCMSYAPAHHAMANYPKTFDSQQPKQYCDLDENASGSLHQVTTRNYFPIQGIVEPWSSDYSHGYQHKPLPGMIKTIPSRTDSGYQTSPSTSSSFKVCRTNEICFSSFPTSSQYVFYAPDRSSRQYSETFDSQQPPKQYYDLDETVTDSWYQVTEPSSSTYDHFQHQSMTDTIEAKPSHSATRKRAAPKNQNPRPAKKSRLAGKQLSHSPSTSMQTPTTQDFDRESCNSYATTFELNSSSSSHNNSPPLLQPVAQKLPVDFFDLGYLQKCVQKKPELEKLREKAKKESKRRARREVNDENRRGHMDRDCDYTKKHTSKVKTEIIRKIDEFFGRLGKIERITSNERLVAFSLELDNLLKGRVDNSDREVYEAQKRQFFSTDDDWEQTVEKILQFKTEFEEAKIDFLKKSEDYDKVTKKVENCSKDEKKKAKGTVGGAKTRAKEKMENAELDYDIACLDLIISKTPQLSSLALEFAKWCANKIASRPSSDTKKIMEWIDSDEKKKKWKELKAFVEENPELRQPNLYNYNL